MFDKGDRVVVRNLPWTCSEYEGKKGVIRFGLDDRMITDWAGGMTVMPGYRVEFDDWETVRVPAVCTYSKGD